MPEKINDIDFSALLCSRLCHDLISPVGAIANGLEILGDENDVMMREEVMKLLSQSAEAATARLKFYRLSFGAAAGFGENLPLTESEAAIRGLYAAGNINLIWQSSVGAMDKAAMKLMMNLTLLAGDSLIRGGDMIIEINSQDSKINIAVTVQGEKIIFQEAVRKALLGGEDEAEIEAKTAPACLAANMARKLGCDIIYTRHNEQSFSLGISCPEPG